MPYYFPSGVASLISEKDPIHKSWTLRPGFLTFIITNKEAVFLIWMEILWVSVVGIYWLYGLGALECFCYISQGKKKRKWKKLSLVERLIFHLDTCLIDNPIYFIGSPTCISHTLQVGSCLAQGEGSDEHREEHLQEMEGSIAPDSYYSLTRARLLNVQVFLVQPSQENEIQKWKVHFTVAPVDSPFSQGEW